MTPQIVWYKPSIGKLRLNYVFWIACSGYLTQSEGYWKSDNTINNSLFSKHSHKLWFSQPFEKCMSEVVRIGSIIIFHLNKLWKATIRAKTCWNTPYPLFNVVSMRHSSYGFLSNFPTLKRGRRVTIVLRLLKCFNSFGVDCRFIIVCDIIFLVRLQGKFEIDCSWEWKTICIYKLYFHTGCNSARFLKPD